MKKVGLIGGMSWESTQLYYCELNQIIKKELGGLHSARCIINSLDFEVIEALQSSNQWDKSAHHLIQAAQELQKAGVDCIAICSNTMHKVAPQVMQSIDVPFIHIAIATRDILIQNKISKVGLLGTKYTMEDDFYKMWLTKAGINVIIPNKEDKETVHNIIFDELCLGKVKKSSKQLYLTIIDKMIQDGAQGIILGCTEIGMLIKQTDTAIPLFDTTYIHVNKLAAFALDQDGSCTSK